MDTSPTRTGPQRTLIVTGPAVAVLTAWLLSLPERNASAGVTLTNVALVIAVVTVGVATMDWLAGVTTSLAAALALNYFHTEPYRTLRITDRRDVYSIVLLGAMGLAVSATTAARVRFGVTRLRKIDARQAGANLEALLTANRPAPVIWSAAIHSAANDLGLVYARLTDWPPNELPNIRRRSVTPDDALVELPQSGAAIPLHGTHIRGRWLVLAPQPGMGPLTLDRRAVAAFADAIELALEPPPNDAELAPDRTLEPTSGYSEANPGDVHTVTSGKVH